MEKFTEIQKKEQQTQRKIANSQHIGELNKMQN